MAAQILYTCRLHAVTVPTQEFETCDVTVPQQSWNTPVIMLLSSQAIAKGCKRHGHFCLDLATLELFWLHSIQVQPIGLILHENEPQVKTRTMTVNGNTCMKYIRRYLMFHVSQIPIHIDLNFARLSRVQLQLFDRNSHTHLIYRKEEA